MKEKCIHLLFVTIVLVLSACKKSDQHSLKPTVKSIYVVGNESNGTTMVAKYWKDGVATTLTDGTNNAQAYSIFILGTDMLLVRNQTEQNG